MSAEVRLLDYETRERWLAGRHQGIGASESAAIFGLSPFDSPISLWAKKTGKIMVNDAEREQNKLLKWGARLEPTIAAGYQEDSGRKLWKASPFAVGVHPSIPHMMATPDYFIEHAPDRSGNGLAEIKNVIVWRADDWADGPPIHVQIQAQHQMAVFPDYDYVAAVPLFGGNDDRPVDIERNQGFIDELQEQVKRFWFYVENDIRPPVDASVRTLDTLKKLHPMDNGDEVKLPAEAIAWWDELAKCRAMEAEAKKRKPAAEAPLLAAIGSATYGVLPDGRRLSLKTTSVSGYEVQPNTYRSLRLEKAPKGKAK